MKVKPFTKEDLFNIDLTFAEINVNTGPKKTVKQHALRTKLMKKVFSKVGIKLKSLEPQHMVGIEIPAETVYSLNVAKSLHLMIPELKQVFSSNSLASLHKNALQKQKSKFLGINMIRQLTKACGYKIRTRNKSAGYEKSTGKKILTRHYIIYK